MATFCLERLGAEIASEWSKFGRTPNLAALDRTHAPRRSWGCDTMSDGSKGISLRKKKASTRPQISGPRPIPESRPSVDAPAPDNGSIYDGAQLIRTETSHSTLRSKVQTPGADKTADLVKRRYSTRFVGFPLDDGPPPPMPDVPAIPPRFGRPKSRSPTRDNLGQSPVSKGLKVDVRALRDPSLVPEQCRSSTVFIVYQTDTN